MHRASAASAGAPRTWRSGQWLAAALSGALYFVAFPGIDVWPLAAVAWVPLLVALELDGEGSWRRDLALGLVFGVVTNLGGYYWLVGMLQRFSGFPIVVCVLFALVLCAYQGGLLAGAIVLLRMLRRRGVALVLAAPVAVVAAELTYPLLFPSYYGACFHDVPLALQVADLGGPLLVPALAIAVNAWVARLIVARRAQPSVRHWERWAVPVLVAAALAYGAFRISDIDARARAARSISVGLVQTNMGLVDKREDPREGRRRHIEQSLELERELRPDVLVWPESAFAWFIDESTTVLREEVLGPLRTPVLFGGLALRGGADRKTARHYNTAFLLDAEGRVLGSYDKTYLLAFGEYLPFGDVFPILYDWSPNTGRFSAGAHVDPLVLDGVRFSVLLCYEDILPAFVRKSVRHASPHVLVNLTNDAWFGDTSEPWQHLALAKLRAVEHHRALVRSTNSGVSAVIDPVGRTVTRSGVFTRENLHARVPLLQHVTLYASLGDWPGWLAWGAVVVVLLRSWRRSAADRHARGKQQ